MKEELDPGDDVWSKVEGLEGVEDEGVGDAVERLLEVDEQDEGRLFLADCFVHQVDDV